MNRSYNISTEAGHVPLLRDFLAKAQETLQTVQLDSTPNGDYYQQSAFKVLSTSFDRQGNSSRSAVHMESVAVGHLLVSQNIISTSNYIKRIKSILKRQIITNVIIHELGKNL